MTRGPEVNPLYHAFVDAAVAAGYPRSANMNEIQHEGFGPMEMTVGDGMRALRTHGLSLAVDVSSGIEAGKGLKDADKMRQFVQAVRAADSTLHS